MVRGALNGRPREKQGGSEEVLVGGYSSRYARVLQTRAPKMSSVLVADEVVLVGMVTVLDGWCTAGERKGQRGQVMAAGEDDSLDQCRFPFPLLTEKY